jgi:hypothetical protein
LEIAAQFLGDIVEEFGEEKFDTLCALFEELKTLMRKKLKEEKR